VGRGEPVVRAKVAEGTGLGAMRSPHQELVNNNYYYRSSSDGA
jgi:hypothetical protein